MWMAAVATRILLAHVGDGGVRMGRLDLERCNQRILRLNGDLVRTVAVPGADHVMQAHRHTLLDLVPPAASTQRSGLSTFSTGLRRNRCTSGMPDPSSGRR